MQKLVLFIWFLRFGSGIQLEYSSRVKASRFTTGWEPGIEPPHYFRAYYSVFRAYYFVFCPYYSVLRYCYSAAQDPRLNHQLVVITRPRSEAGFQPGSMHVESSSGEERKG